jgi:hypothetical protein
MRPPGRTTVASVMTSAAPPTARLPRCTKCQSFVNPSTLEYWHIGETPMRFRNRMSRNRNGVNKCAACSGKIFIGFAPASRIRPFRRMTREKDSRNASGLQKPTSRGTNKQPGWSTKRAGCAQSAYSSWGLAVGEGASSSVSKSADEDVVSAAREDPLTARTAPFLWLPSDFVTGSVAVGS